MSEASHEYAPRTAHTPVLLQEVIDVLALTPADVVVDGTAGGGGHAEAILARLGQSGVYYAIDRDEHALARVRTRLGSDTRLRLMQGNFRSMDELARAHGCERADKVLLDLGLSSDQLGAVDGAPGRGFSFGTDEPLLMTFGTEPASDETTAYDVVNAWSEESLADIIFGFGGEPRARSIARAIIEAREQEPIRTSGALARVIESAVPRRGATHPATKTFQAIRMAVNDELGALEEALQRAYGLLAMNGRVAVITFHSLEDRMVKRTFLAWQREARGRVITKHPIVPGREECVRNRRARSAKLRCFCKEQS